jgi:hypothetical protein
MARVARQFGRGLYWVPSHTADGLEYLVDVEGDADYEEGQCDCQHFVNRIAPYAPTHATCKHIAEVWAAIRRASRQE